MTDAPLNVRALLAEPNPYPTRDRRRVSAWIRVESWHGWGAGARS